MKLLKKVTWATNVKKENQKIGIKKISFKLKFPRLRNDGNVRNKKHKHFFEFWQSNKFIQRKITALKKGTKQDFIYNGSFHEAVGPVLLMAECFSVMPVTNVTAKSAKDLFYSWKSIKNLYSIIVMLMTLAFTVLIIMWSFTGSIQFDKIVPVVFYLSNSLARLFFLLLAMKWPLLMKQWKEVEDKLPPFETQQEKALLAFKIKMISIIIMLLSMSEHLLSIISTAFYSIMCTTNKIDPFEDYFRMEQNQLFVYFEYSPHLAFFGKMLNILSTFLWTFMDLFVIIISIGLSAQFKKINRHLMKYKGQAMPESYWVDIRSNYRNMCKLCEAVDDAIGPITLISFANNLYFVPMPSIAHAAYFWFSLIFLISRKLAVSLYSADINDESKKPIRALRSCPAVSWCMEVKRFYYEVCNDVVTLSGMKFFHLTRSLVLTVAGTIVTYELVLIQFHHIDHSSGKC